MKSERGEEGSLLARSSTLTGDSPARFPLILFPNSSVLNAHLLADLGVLFHERLVLHHVVHPLLELRVVHQVAGHLRMINVSRASSFTRYDIPLTPKNRHQRNAIVQLFRGSERRG
eukprot:646235-Rhodomonas_salina.2